METLINLTYQNKEIIIVDDASIDGTPKIINNYIKKHEFMKLIK
jgi:glycosyltransferase involved in cell wall biosynthesis